MDFHEALLRLFDYNPNTGWFTNKRSRGRALQGARAGSPTSHGYRRIVIAYEKYYEHHLAWFYIHGEWPYEIDHKDGNGCNNAIDNLRLASRTENNFNRVNSSELSGAYLDKRINQWYSKIQVDGQVIRLGIFNTPEEAHDAYLEALDRYAGEFAYQNREPKPLTQEEVM